jgi:hypothetical protein
MQILQVKEYNANDMQRYNERVAKWQKEKSNNIIPQIAFVGFRLPNGEMRQRGWVAVSDDYQSAKFQLNKQKLLDKIK